MPLSKGDYRTVEDQVVLTLLADTDSGGLMEPGSPAVAGVFAGDPELHQSFGQDRFPVILVRAVSKKEGPGAPVYSILKTFQVNLWVLDRGLDRAAAEESVRRIAARMERVLRRQTSIDGQFLGLPDLIEGSEGVLAAQLKETVFSATRAESDRVVARAQAGLEIQVPCAYRFE